MNDNALEESHLSRGNHRSRLTITQILTPCFKSKYYHLIGIITYIVCICLSYLIINAYRSLLNKGMGDQSKSLLHNSIDLTDAQNPIRNLNEELNSKLNHFVSDIPFIEAFLLENNRHQFDGKWSIKNKFDFENLDGSGNVDIEKESNGTSSSISHHRSDKKDKSHEIRSINNIEKNREGKLRNEAKLVSTIESMTFKTTPIKSSNNNYNYYTDYNPDADAEIYQFLNEAIESPLNSGINRLDKSFDDNLINSKSTLTESNPNGLNILSDFTHSEGNLRISLQVEKTEFAEKNLSFIFEIKDGKYKDKWISIKQTFPLFLYSNLNYNTVNFNFEFDEELKDYVTRINLRRKMNFNAMVFKMNMYNVEEGFLSTTDDLEIIFYNNKYAKIKGKMELKEIGINLYFKAKLDKENFDRKILNFTLALTFIGIVHLYNTLTLIKDILMVNINPKSFSVTLLVFDLNWNSILSLGTFYIASSYPNYFNNFGMPSMIYFLNFSIFQIRLLFLVWKSQNIMESDYERNQEARLKKKLLRFYFSLYTSLILGLITIYFILTYKTLLFILISFTFLPQIVHNYNVNMLRNKIPLMTTLVMSLNKLFFLLYFRVCPYNIFEAKPDIAYTAVIMFLLFAQILIMTLQGIYGAKFFIPKTYRRGYYNYYRTYSEMTCAICLSNLILDETVIVKSTSNDFTLTSDELIEIKSNKDINISEKKCFSLLRKCKRKNIFSPNLKLMLTPCKHIFHPECLKLWAEKKNECPVCRRGIPCIED